MENTKFKVRDFRNKQFFQVDDEYLNGYAKFLGPIASMTYVSLCRHADKNQVAFPSKKLIAIEIGSSERAVYTAIKDLESWGIIGITRQGRQEDGSYKNLVYSLMDKSSWSPKPSANGAVGKKRHYPSANDDTTRRHVVPNKDTHSKDTHRRKKILENLRKELIEKKVLHR